ncbi:acetamidase/formamidase family protein [Thermoanaerobacterium thermosaccharolyticum]|uniref:acetamidase/formamidase family protein n=1 Tax=Thermoanaerobacterium thermosaccharolyticum TaxID=1517 RepID=UPI003DA93477
MKFCQTVYVDEFTNGILDPNEQMTKGVKDGGRIIANTAPGCWGPMITPAIKGGHEVTKPVYVEGAEIGDSVALFIESIKITSIATSSGNDHPIDGRYISDAFIAAKCPHCGKVNPDTEIKGIGQNAIVCKNCGAVVTPFEFTNGYTIAFDQQKGLGITVNQEISERIARDGRKFMCIPDRSIQNPVVTIAPHDMVGTVSRIRPMLGQLGTIPSRAFPDSHNAGDFAQALIGAEHDYAMTKDEIKDRTDGHMDINFVREGVWVICPVKVKGAGVYLGDMHAEQGDGEIAGHTTDVAGIVQLKVKLLKNFTIDGPIILPLEEDLPYLAKPLTKEEKERALKIANAYGMNEIEDSLPMSFVGTGTNLNEATLNGMERAAKLLDITVPEVMNRATITGAIRIGRNPGVVTVTFLVPKSYLKHDMFINILENHYSN